MLRPDQGAQPAHGLGVGGADGVEVKALTGGHWRHARRNRGAHLPVQRTGEPDGRPRIPGGLTRPVVVAVAVEQQVEAAAGPDLDQRQWRATSQARHRGEGRQQQIGRLLSGPGVRRNGEQLGIVGNAAGQAGVERRVVAAFLVGETHKAPRQRLERRVGGRLCHLALPRMPDG